MAVEWIRTPEWNRMCGGSGSWRLLVTPSLAYKGGVIIVEIKCYDISTNELSHTLLSRISIEKGGMELYSSSIRPRIATLLSYRSYDSRVIDIPNRAVSAYVKLIITETAIQLRHELDGLRLEHDYSIV